MTGADWIVLGLLAAAVLLALRSIRRSRKQGKTCSGDCGSCRNHCE